MTRQQLYIHIGMPKTGTTSLQFFMHYNRQLLAEAGIYYPQTMRQPSPAATQHRFLNTYMRDQQRESRETGKPIRYHALNAITQEIQWHKHPRNVISEEILSYDPDFSAPYLARFRENFDTRILVFLRRQDLWAESMYAQSVRGGLRGDFQSFIKNRATFERMDFLKYLDVWAKHFGQENVIVRPYIEGATNSAQEILTLLHAPAKAYKPVERRNESLSKEAIMVIQRFNPMGDPTYASFNEIYGRALGAATDRMPLVFMTRAERQDMLDTYAPGNAQVARNYLEPLGVDKELFPIDPATFPDDALANTTLSQSRLLEILENLARATLGPEALADLPGEVDERTVRLQDRLIAKCKEKAESKA